MRPQAPNSTLAGALAPLDPQRPEEEQTSRLTSSAPTTVAAHKSDKPLFLNSSADGKHSPQGSFCLLSILGAASREPRAAPRLPRFGTVGPHGHLSISRAGGVGT